MAIFSVAKNSPVAIYQQIKRSLSQVIENGTLKHGDPIPSDNELASRFKISRMTARKATQECVGRNLGGRSSYRLVQQRLDPQAKRTREIIDCCRAPKWVAALPQVELATAVIACQREVFLEDRTPAEYATAYARGDLLKSAFERTPQERQRGAGTGTVRTPLACIPFQQLHRWCSQRQAQSRC